MQDTHRQHEGRSWVCLCFKTVGLASVKISTTFINCNCGTEDVRIGKIRKKQDLVECLLLEIIFSSFFAQKLMGNASSISRPCPEALPAVSFSQKELALISIVRYAKGKERIFGTTKEPDSLLLHHEFILLDVVNTTTGERTFWRAEYGHLSLVWFTMIGKELPPEEQDGVYQFLEPVVPRTLADLPRTQGLFYDARCNNCQFYTGRVMLFLQRCPLPYSGHNSLHLAMKHQRLFSLGCTS